MLLQERIESFIRLGHVLRDFCNRENGKDSNPATSHKLMDSLRQAAANAQLENPWFTKENILFAMQSIALNLNRDDLESWLKPYLTDLEKNSDARTVAVIMAGNIPMVGFHDFLCVLMSGNRFLGKLSSDDKLLLPAMTGILIEFNPGWDAYISFTQDPIRSFDAVIATGSNSSSGYFEYYFSRYPHIIRKNRNSIAILTGKESAKELSSLAMDIFLYFGLGCRRGMVNWLALPGTQKP